MFNFKRKSATTITVFNTAVKQVPAYRTFLEKNKINPDSIKTEQDFKMVPLMEKDNYLRAYPLDQIVKNNKIPPMISASSGSSGMPFYWPRGDEQEFGGGILHERIFKNIFQIGNRKTLLIVCFSMGNWVAGTFTAASARYVARQKDTNLSIITPGIEREDIMATIRDLAPQFEVVILAGYPPFVMDIVEEAHKRDISLTKFSLRFLFAGENFSETWRQTICESAGVENTLTTSISVYGSADACALGNENPLTVFIRRKATQDLAFKTYLFGEASSFVPSLVQFDPTVIQFETVDGSLVFTTDGGIPLVRYNIKDQGKVLEQKELIQVLKEFNYYEEARELLRQWPYPMVALFGRTDVAVTFYALNIYPENIKAGLEGKDFSAQLTGKFIANVERSDDEKEQRLVISVELAEGIPRSEMLAEKIKTSLFDSLIRLNAEYRKLYNAIHVKAQPAITVEEYGNEMFKIKKSKHKWVKK